MMEKIVTSRRKTIAQAVPWARGDDLGASITSLEPEADEDGGGGGDGGGGSGGERRTAAVRLPPLERHTLAHLEQMFDTEAGLHTVDAKLAVWLADVFGSAAHQ